MATYLVQTPVTAISAAVTCVVTIFSEPFSWKQHLLDQSSQADSLQDARLLSPTLQERISADHLSTDAISGIRNLMALILVEALSLDAHSRTRI